jgi:hypothetical protein
MFLGGRSMMGGAGSGAAPGGAPAGGGPWSAEEIALLKVGVERHSSDWKAVSRVVGSRSNQQCKDKYRLEVSAGRITDARTVHPRGAGASSYEPPSSASPTASHYASYYSTPLAAAASSASPAGSPGLGLGASAGFSLGGSSNSGTGSGFGLGGLSVSSAGTGFGPGGSSSSGEFSGVVSAGAGAVGGSSSARAPAMSSLPVVGGPQATADATAAVLQKLAALAQAVPSAPAPAPGSDEAKLAQFWSERLAEAQVTCASGVVKVTSDQDVPQQRVRRIMKNDEAENNFISGDSVALLARASSLFAQELTMRSWLECERSGYRMVGKRQIADALQREPNFAFLLPLVDGSLDHLEGPAGGDTTGPESAADADGGEAGEAGADGAHDGAHDDAHDGAHISAYGDAGAGDYAGDSAGERDDAGDGAGGGERD